MEKGLGEGMEKVWMDNLEIDYKKAAQQLRSGETLLGTDVKAPLLERILNSQLSVDGYSI